MRLLYFCALLFFASNTFAQWECRSHLAANLKPLYNGSGISWGTELIGSGGYLTNSYIASGMAFAGIDYTKNNHQFYFEGGAKYWFNRDLDLQYNFSKQMFGLRELSYSYSIPTFDLRIGLQSVTAGDYFLVNERAWGTSLKKTIGDWSFNASAATVTKNFARNGIFCTNSYLYDIVDSRNFALGNAWGNTNFATIAFTKKVSDNSAGSESASDNEFEEFSTDSVATNNSGIRLKSYGTILYSEFGSYYASTQFHFGPMAEVALSNFATIKAEGLFQQAENNRAYIFYIQAEKSKEWTSGNITTFQAFYLGKKNIDNHAVAMPRFSNLFLGEVFRMDVIDMPLVNFSLKHQFVNSTLSLKLQYSRQLKDNQMQELDFSAGKFILNKHLRITALTGLMHANNLSGTSALGRIEIRAFF